MADSETPRSGLQGADFALAMFATMFLATGAVLDALRSVALGAASVLVTGLGLWLLFRWLKSGRPQWQRLLGALGIVGLTVAVRLLLGLVLAPAS